VEVPDRDYESVGVAGAAIVRADLGWVVSLAGVGDVDGCWRAVRPTLRRMVRLRSFCASSAREGVGLLDGFEADAEVEMTRCWVVRLEDDLDSLRAGLGK